MESSDSAALDSTATNTSATAEQLAEQVRALEAAVARYAQQLSSAQEANRDWERIFDAIEDPICVVTVDYQLIHANSAYIRLFGTAYELGGRHYCFALAVDQTDRSGPCADCPLPETVRTCRAGFTQQVWQSPSEPGNAPQIRTYQRWTYPVVNADGTVERVVEVVKDVTEQERIRRSVAKTAALREADRLKAELLGTVSHELRGPLTAIKGYAATLLRHERRLPREERREFLEAIGEASDRLEVIINRLLELSQLETGSIVPHFAPVDVAQLARESIAFAEQRAQVSEPGTYVFSLRLLDGYGVLGRTSPWVDADARLLRDALDNLLENAVKYSPDGGSIEITVGMRAGRGVEGASADPVEEPEVAGAPRATPRAAGAVPPDMPDMPDMPQMLEITVRDTGVGIPAEHLGRVFERFHRVDTRLTREVDGLGMGLAMCKRIAELHGGSIWAESVPGQGSNFHLVLPPVASATRSQALVPRV